MHMHILATRAVQLPDFLNVICAELKLILSHYQIGTYKFVYTYKNLLDLLNFCYYYVSYLVHLQN